MRGILKIETSKDWAYYSRLALLRYRISSSRLRYLESDSRFLEELDDKLIENLIKYFAQPDLFCAEEFDNIPIATILEYLRKTHVLYIYKRLPEIAQAIHILQTGCDEPEGLLIALDVFFKDYSRHLIQHVDREEVRLFKYVAGLIDCFEAERKSSAIIDREILREFSEEHDDTEFDLRHARKVLRSFLPSSQNQTPYRILMEQLRNFEVDLHIHSRIEEEVLLPRAIELETLVAG